VTEALSFLDPIHSIPGIRAGWIERVTDLPITGDRDQAMAQLRPWHTAALEDSTGSAANWWRAEQIHGTELAVVPSSATIIAPDGLPVVPGVDGLISRQPGIVLSIYVADCGAIWLADRKTRGVGLLHSGKKGTEGNILEKALNAMHDHFGTRPDDVVAVLSPCIRPPFGAAAPETGRGRMPVMLIRALGSRVSVTAHPRYGRSGAGVWHHIDEYQPAAACRHKAGARHELALVITAFEQHIGRQGFDERLRSVLIEYDHRIAHAQLADEGGAGFLILDRTSGTFECAHRRIAVHRHHEPVAMQSRRAQ
jgi:hypothetical protein